MYKSEAVSLYRTALKAGQKNYKDCIRDGEYPYLEVLDELLGDAVTAGRMDMGVIDIPADRIAGTCYAGRRNAFAANFMPLLPSDTEFALKWVNLCASALEEGIRDPITCFEYQGKFYVQEGNKRVSVQKALEAYAISANVIRILPSSHDEDEASQIYQEFILFHRCTGIYWVYFDKPGCFTRLMNALKRDPSIPWTDDERLTFSSAFFRFRRGLERLGKSTDSVDVSFALLIWLEVYSLEELTQMPENELDKSILNLWQEVEVQSQPESIAVSMTPVEPSGNLLTRIFSPNHLKLGFIHEEQYDGGAWLSAHEDGWSYMENCLSKEVDCQKYLVPKDGSAEAVMKQAIQDGCTVLFTTTVNLITPCRKVAAEHRNIRILNCSVSMPYPGVRTYYSRIYEAKFISGAIAGILSKTDDIGYVAESPIYGAPASINAFALGAKMTHPNARIHLRWDCVPGDPVAELLESGAELISNRDSYSKDLDKGLGGLLQLQPDGSLESVASPFWNWGNFYIHIVNSLLKGGWDESVADTSKAVNYWWGMNCGVVDIRLSDKLPEGLHQLARILRRGIAEGSVSPFHCCLTDQNGNEISDGHRWFSPDELLRMDWLCDNVVGAIPAYDDLLPEARQIVRLQGIYREDIPPEKEDAAL